MKQATPAPKYRRVEVEWEDSTQPYSSWRFVRDFQLLEPMRCVSIGFLLEQNNRVIGLAPNLSEIGTDGEQARE
jgi:hypothetical protein